MKYIKRSIYHTIWMFIALLVILAFVVLAHTAMTLEFNFNIYSPLVLGLLRAIIALSIATGPLLTFVEHKAEMDFKQIFNDENQG